MVDIPNTLERLEIYITPCFYNDDLKYLKKNYMNSVHWNSAFEDVSQDTYYFSFKISP